MAVDTGHSVEEMDSISVDMIGTLKGGVVAVGGESTGTIITSGSVTWELEFEPADLSVAKTLNGKKVRIRGDLRQQAGTEIAKRTIVKVDSLQAISQSLPNTKNSFRTITLTRTGGFAGLMQKLTIHVSGSVEIEDKKTARRSKEKLKPEALEELKALISVHNWKKIPPQDPRSAVIDGMQYSVVIESGEGPVKFVTDDGSSRKIKHLQRLLFLVQQFQK